MAHASWPRWSAGPAGFAHPKPTALRSPHTHCSLTPPPPAIPRSYYGPDCSNSTCPGTHCYYDAERRQHCTHCCTATSNQTSGYDFGVQSYRDDVRKVPCSQEHPGEEHGSCDGFGMCQCVPPYLGEDCSMQVRVSGASQWCESVVRVRGASQWCESVVRVSGASQWCESVVRVSGASQWCESVVRVSGASQSVRSQHHI
jgi:hypothetical protein